MKINIKNMILILFIFNIIVYFFGEFINEYLLLYNIPSILLTIIKLSCIVSSVILSFKYFKLNEILIIWFLLYVPLSAFIFTLNLENVFYFNLIVLLSISFCVFIVSYIRSGGTYSHLAKLFISISLIFSVGSFCVDFLDLQRHIPNMMSRSYHCGESYAFRWCGVTQNPNLLAIYCVFFVIFNFFLLKYIDYNRKKWKLLSYISLFFILVDLIMSMSRASIGFMILFLIINLVINSDLKHKIKVLLFLIVCVLFFICFSPFFDFNLIDQDVLSRINDASNSVRLNLMMGGLDIFINNFVLGIGYNLSPSFNEYVPGWNHQIDSYYINILYTQGIFIALFYFMLFVYLIIKLINKKAYSILAILMSFLVILVIEDHFYKTPFFWVLLGFIFLILDKEKNENMCN